MVDTIKAPFAENGNRSPVQAASGSGEVNFDSGYTAYYEIDLGGQQPDPTAKAVERPEFNYLLWLITGHLKNLQDAGYQEWRSDLPLGYSKGASVYKTLMDNTDPQNPKVIQIDVYRSLANNNQQDPAGSTQWEKQLYDWEILDKIAMPFGGSTISKLAATPDAGLITAAKAGDFNQLINGTWVVKDAAAFNAMSGAPTPGQIEAADGGLLEARSFTTLVNGTVSQPFTIQRYTTFGGEVLMRSSKAGGGFKDWTPLVRQSDVQKDKYNFSDNATLQGATVNLTLVPTPAMTSTNTYEGMKVRAKFNSSIPLPANATIQISGSAVRKLYNANFKPVRGGELQPGCYFAMVCVVDGKDPITNANTYGWIITESHGLGSPNLVNLEVDRGLIPIGGSIQWHSDTLPLNGYFLKANGATFNPAVRPELAAVFPNGVLPDLRGCAPRGKDDGRGLDPNRAINSYQGDELKSHDHDGRTNDDGLHSHSGSAMAGGDHQHSGNTNNGGVHHHNGRTGGNGNHVHEYAGDDQLNAIAGQRIRPAGRYDADSDTDHTGFWYNTLASGWHDHDFQTDNGNSDHSHWFQTDVGGSRHTHNLAINNGGVHGHNFRTNPTGGAETRMKNVAVHFIIRAY